MESLHPNIQKFVDNYENEAKRKGYIRKKIGKYELIFLEKVWGPLFDYDFEHLHIEHPFMDAKGGQRFIDFLYKCGSIRIAIEIDGFTAHARNISPKEFDDHLERQNDLMENGWYLLRFSAYRVEHFSRECQDRIKKAIGFCWVQSYRNATDMQTEMWNLRLNCVMEAARNNFGKIKASQLAAQLNTSNRTIHNWMKKFVKEGYFQEIRGKKNVIGYQLNQRHER